MKLKKKYKLKWRSAVCTTVCPCGKNIKKGDNVAFFSEMDIEVCRCCGLVWEKDLFEPFAPFYDCNSIIPLY